MKRNRREEGFGVVAIIIVSIMVAIIGVIAWRIYESANSQSQQNSTTPQPDNDKNSTSDSVQPDLNENYIVIREWGVRFKVSDDRIALKYFKPQGIKSDALSFMTDELAVKEPHCSQGMATGLLTRSIDPLPGAGGVITVIDGFSYQYRGSDAACSENEANLPLENATAQLISGSIKSLEKAR